MTTQHKKQVLVLFILMVTTLGFMTTLSGEEMTRVNGLFYLDQMPVTIEMQDGIITQIIRTEKSDENPKVYIAPGFIDVQINGFTSISFSDEELTLDGVRKATRALWKEGVTTYFPTIISSSHEITKQNCKILATAIKDPEIGQSLPGIFLEGPYISPIDGFRGAHNLKWVRSPDVNELKEYVEASEHSIIKVGLAPELDGIFDIISYCVQEGIAISLAHHNGSAEQIKRAADAGATVVTHLGNGCANMIHRHNNPLWPQLAEDRLVATIIADGHHLRPEEMRVFYKTKGVDGLMLVSDVTRLAGMPPGEYVWDGKTVVMTPEGMIMFPEQNVLAGAALPISVGVGNMIKTTQCSLADAVHMAGKNQARVFNLHDRGEIVPGKRADLVLFTMDNNKIEIQKTILAGKVVYAKQ